VDQSRLRSAFYSWILFENSLDNRTHSHSQGSIFGKDITDALDPSHYGGGLVMSESEVTRLLDQKTSAE
jgi:hypothetical protein